MINFTFLYHEFMISLLSLLLHDLRQGINLSFFHRLNDVQLKKVALRFAEKKRGNVKKTLLQVFAEKKQKLEKRTFDSIFAEYLVVIKSTKKEAYASALVSKARSIEQCAEILEHVNELSQEQENCLIGRLYQEFMKKENELFLYAHQMKVFITCTSDIDTYKDQYDKISLHMDNMCIPTVPPYNHAGSARR